MGDQDRTESVGNFHVSPQEGGGVIVEVSGVALYGGDIGWRTYLRQEDAELLGMALIRLAKSGT